MVLALYPNARMSGLSLRLPSLRWFPKYSSHGSWQNRSVRTNSVPSWSKNLVASITEWTVICMPSWVCHDRNMRALAFWVKFPGRFSVLSFQSLRYSRNSIRNWNLKSEKNATLECYWEFKKINSFNPNFKMQNENKLPSCNWYYKVLLHVPVLPKIFNIKSWTSISKVFWELLL